MHGNCVPMPTPFVSVVGVLQCPARRWANIERGSRRSDFEGLDSEREIAWRAADSLALREFLGLALAENGLDEFSDEIRLEGTGGAAFAVRS
jgi:hypothetical protein